MKKIISLIGCFLMLATSTVFAQSQQSEQALDMENIATQANSDNFTIMVTYPNTINPDRFIYELKPGEQTLDYITVLNRSDVELTLSAYGTDGTKSQQNTFAVKTKTQTQENIGAWVKFEQPTFTLKPGEYKTLRFTVAVPSNTALGDYQGGIAIEKTKKDSQNASITIASRLVKRVDLKVTHNPKLIPKKSMGPQSSLPGWYFWVSLSLFCISAGVLIWLNIKEKRHKHKRS